MIAPAWADAHNDRELRGVAIALYDELWRVIDPVNFTAVKLAPLCLRLGISENAGRESLVLLARKGYVERGRKIDRRHTYKLAWERSKRNPQ